ncbi:RNA polymerase sigma factor SigM [soil metagenome]
MTGSLSVVSHGDDRDLLQRVSTGDRRAFDELMLRHEDRVFAVCLRIMRQREAALDAVQDTFLTVFRKADRFRGESAFTTWLYRIAVNTCYDHLRKAKRRPTEPLPEGHDPPDRSAGDVLASVELRPDLANALADLGEEFRSTIVLVDVEGMGISEAASILEVAEGTVKSRLHRGRRQLAQILGNPMDWG